jgi:ABC-type nitrate/sulfonate/bicarbonate transport system ATPase subunit
MNILEFRGVRFPNSPLHAFPPFDFSLGQGLCAVAFGHGVKRLLLKLSAGVARPEEGEVRVNAPEGRFPVSYIPHEGGLLSNLTLLQNAALPLVYHKKISSRDWRVEARSIFSELGIGQSAESLPSMAGVSSRRLAQFARAKLLGPALLVVEEPFGEVDAQTAKTIRSMLERARSEGKTSILLSTSDPRAWLALGDVFLFVGQGRIDLFPSREALLAGSDAEVRSFLD